MLFNSLEFLLFLPVVFLLYWFVFGSYAPKWLGWLANTKVQNFFIVVVSYIFYGWWDWRFLLLIALTSFGSWLSGVLIATVETRRWCVFCQHDSFPLGRRTIGVSLQRKIILWANIILNLGILGFFKYFNFFVQSFIDAFAGLGITLHATTLNIILPVGISFYTFQALSYSIDVYKGKIEATRDIVAFFAFVSFFPQLVAGPIERATNLLPQFQKPRTFNYEKAIDGCRQILWGFFKKLVVADNCAAYVDQAFESCAYAKGTTLFFAAIFFTFQIYGDFSGYSNIAIGSARLFGIDLKRNFNFPYFSRNIAEFWRRWHISLTTWFRDYVYIPLGGSRTTKTKIVRNILIIFLLSGLWHGANWTFIAWGAYHALLFLPLILLGKNRKYTNIVASKIMIQEDVREHQKVKLRLFPSILELVQMLCTFFLVVVGWILFRAETLTQAFAYIDRIIKCGISAEPMKNGFTLWTIWASICFLLIIEWLQRDKQHALELNPSLPKPLRWAIPIIIALLVLWFGGHAETFIYFQF